MADPLQGIEDDVEFDFGAADTLATKADLAATGVDGTVGGRNFWTSHAMAEFRGHFSELFQSNSTTANTDAGELADALRLVADAARRLKEEAEKENERRRIAREWEQAREDRSLLEKGWDKVTDGGDDPPVGSPADPQILDVPAGSNGVRQTPAPGAGGGSGGGTSSARPSDLRGFVTWMGNANLTRRTDLATTRSAYHDFVAGCRWGSLDADGVLAGFSTWLDANDNDEVWVRTVADAFEAAGSEGAVVTLSNSALAAALQAAGVDAARQDLTIPAPSAIGNPGTSGYADDPVNTATGNFIENETDLAFHGGCAGLELSRTYNALATSTGAFGPGWSSWTESRVRFDDESAALVLPDGREVLFPRLGDAWDRATGESMWLTRDGDGFLVSGNDGTRWELSRDGALQAFRRPSGARVHLEHADGRLVRLRHHRGRWIDLVWDADRVVAARASDGRVVSYTYDEHGRLAAATGVLGTRTYGWDDAGLVSSVTSAAGVVEVDNTYDARGRVATQRSPFGRTSRYAYLPGRVTVVSDEDGTRSNTWIADRRGRLVGAVDAHENRQSYSYDAWGNRVLVTERDGAVTVSEHDSRGRLVRRVLPSGADLRWSFDDEDRVTEVVTEEGAVTRMAYEGDDRSPSLLVDPEGGETRMTWTDGLMTRLVDPTGVEVGFAHDEHGDLVAVTAADGGVARLERDGAGRVVAAVDPLGHATRYSYDRRGLLTARQDPTGATWTYEHDEAGRLAVEIDPTGSRRELERGRHGEVDRIVDPLGRATTRSYDDLGNLTAVVLPDGATWRFTHDALSRLVETTDPTGAVWDRDYDEVGLLTRVEDPTGVARHVRTDRSSGEVTAHDAATTAGLRLDRLGRVESTTGPDGSVTLTRHDRCGRVVERVDQTGAVTRLVRDAGGRVVELVSPTGDMRRYEYDRCGRLVTVVDADGGSVAIERDLGGRVVRQVLADGTTIELDHDAAGRVVRRRVAGHGTTRVEHDAAGRVVAVHDPRFGRRTFTRDAAGRVVEAVDARGGTTRYEHDDADRVVASVDPLGARTTYTYDAVGRLVERTDPLGRPVRLSYDAAGRPVEREDPTGHRVGWTYDAAGLPVSLQVDGRTLTSTELDHRARRARIVERVLDGESVHELVWDPRGLLVERSRDGRALRWERDAVGRVVSVTTPDRGTIRYRRDAAGHVVAASHPVLGEVTLERDAGGRVVRAEAGGRTYRWERGDGGQVLSHEDRAADGTTHRTDVRRDEGGRIVEIVQDGVVVRYDHDAAGQLVSAGVGGAQTRWRYDAAGRLVSEQVGDDATVERVYDAAGQLTSSRAGAVETAYAYDAAGRRVRAAGTDGSTEEYAWGPGGLSRIEHTSPDGATRRTTLRVDALGELAEVDGVPVFWDSSSRAGRPLQVGDAVVATAGPLTGIGEGATGSGWTSVGWREVRSGGDPWQPSSAATLDNGLSVGAAGELVVDGLEWLGARVYDQSSRAFLSPDPLAPVLGAAWAGNPYSYAGNDPLHAVDPLGLSPMTDADLAAWSAENKGWGEHVKDFAEEHAVVLGAVVAVAGVVMIATGVGGPLGMAMISAGADMAIQKLTTGDVRWGQVAVSGVMGGISAGAGTALSQSSLAGSRLLTAQVSSQAAIGGFGNTANYMVSAEPDKNARGAFSAFVGGSAAGGLGGASTHLGGSMARYLGYADNGAQALAATRGTEFMAGFGGGVTEDAMNGGDFTLTDSLIKGAGGVAGGELDRQIPTPYVGQHAAPGPWYTDSSGTEGVGSLGGVAADRLADAY